MIYTAPKSNDQITWMEVSGFPTANLTLVGSDTIKGFPEWSYMLYSGVLTGVYYLKVTGVGGTHYFSGAWLSTTAPKNVTSYLQFQSIGSDDSVPPSPPIPSSKFPWWIAAVLGVGAVGAVAYFAMRGKR